MTSKFESRTFKRRISTSLDPEQDWAVWLYDNFKEWADGCGEDYVKPLKGKDDWVNLTSNSVNHGWVAELISYGKRAGLDNTNAERIWFMDLDSARRIYWSVGWNMNSTSNNGLGTWLSTAQSGQWNHSNSSDSSNYWDRVRPSMVIWNDDPANMYFAWQLLSPTSKVSNGAVMLMKEETIPDTCPPNVGAGWAFMDFQYTLHGHTCQSQSYSGPAYQETATQAQWLDPRIYVRYGGFIDCLPVVSGAGPFMGHLDDTIIYAPRMGMTMGTQIKIGDKNYVAANDYYAFKVD